MKTHRRYTRNHNQELYPVKRTILLSLMRKIAQKEAQEHWSIWQRQHTREEIEGLLIHAMDMQERNNRIGWRLLWMDLQDIAKETYEEQISNPKQCLIYQERMFDDHTSTQ
jgi:DNA replicative helicase MCM subunit Mcm2 (Cdc46/Mcm family)